MGINTDDIVDTALDLGSSTAEHAMKKTLNDPPLTSNPEEVGSDKPSVSYEETDTNFWKEADNLGQDLYNNYGHLRDNIEDGDWIQGTKNGLKIGRDILGGDLGHSMKIGEDVIGIYEALQDGDWAKAAALTADALKNGAAITIDSFNLSPRDQFMYNQAMQGLGNLSQTARNNKLAQQAVDKAIERVRTGDYTPAGYSDFDMTNARVNEMRQEYLAQQMKEDRETILSPEYADATLQTYQNTGEGLDTHTALHQQHQEMLDALPTPETAKTDNDVEKTEIATTETKEVASPQQPLTPTQIAMHHAGGRG